MNPLTLGTAGHIDHGKTALIRALTGVDTDRLPQERAKVALQLKHLVTPAGMGETFHVLVASKGLEPGRVAELSGLKFGRPVADDRQRT